MGAEVQARDFAGKILRSAVVVLIALGLAGTPGTARARDAEVDAYSAALTRAIAAKERALDVNEPPRWEEALRLFQEAAALRFTRESTYEIGIAAERLSRGDLAVESYEAAIDLGLVGPPRKRAQAFVAAHASGMARLSLRGRPGSTVRVAGLDRGRLPLKRPLVLFPGDVRLELADPSGASTVVNVRLQPGHLEVLELDAAAARPPAAPVPAPASPAPPSAPAALPPAAADEPAAIAPSPVAAPAPSPPDARPSETASNIPTRGYWLMGAGAVVAVAAAVLLPVSGGQIQSALRDLAGECADPIVDDACTAKEGRFDAAQSLSHSIANWRTVRAGAWVGVGVGLAAVAAGLVLRYLDGADSSSHSSSHSSTHGTALMFDASGGRFTLGAAWTTRF